MPEGRILLIVSSLLANSIPPSSILLVVCFFFVQALIKGFLFYLWCKNVVCTVFLSDGKIRWIHRMPCTLTIFFLTNTIITKMRK